MCCGAGFHGAGLVPCSRAMLWARDRSGVAASSSAAPARSLWFTAQHSLPGHILHPQAWLGACLHTRGTQKWGPLDSRFPSDLTLCLWADDVPPPPAPFAHRTVTLRSASVSSQFTLDSKDILGG